MVTAPVIQSGVEVKVPKTEYTRELTEERLIVSITKDATLFLQNKAVNINDLAAKIREKNPNNSKPKVYVQGDVDSHFGDFVQVMAKLKLGGIEDISLVTEPLDKAIAK
jgi:biopolymer transport protein ExbD/biopolymer transport protein TolR